MGFLTTYPDPQSPGDNITNAYAYNVFCSFNVPAKTGRIEAQVFRSANAANLNAPMVDSVPLTFGQVFTPASSGVEEVRASTFDEFWAKPIPSGLVTQLVEQPAMISVYEILKWSFEDEHLKNPVFSGAVPV